MRLARRLGRARRIVLTGLGWIYFGALALSIAIFVVPGGRSLSRNEAQLRVQSWINRAYRRWSRAMMRLGLIQVRWLGEEKLAVSGAAVLVANHPSLIDAPLILARLEHGDVIVAADKARHPVLRACVEGAGYVSNARGPEAVHACVERLRAGRSLLLFPEGTRSPLGGLGEFKRGAAQIALRAGCPIVPIVVHVDPPMLRKGQRWYDIPVKPAVFTLEVGESFYSKDVASESRSAGVRARALNTAMREMFLESLRGRSGPGAGSQDAHH